MKQITIFIITLFITAMNYGQTILLDENFNGASIPSGWSVNHALGAEDWTFGSGVVPGDVADFSSNAAIFDDDSAPDTTPNRAYLSAPSVDISAYEIALLDYTYAMSEVDSGEALLVKISDPDSYSTLATYTTDTDPTDVQIDIKQIADALGMDTTQIVIYFRWDDNDSWSYGCGVDDVKITGYNPPDNNNCIDATTLNVGTTVSATNVDATDSGMAAPSCGSYNGGDVWFSVEVPSSGVLMIETADNGGISDTVMAVYEGSCGSLSGVQCDDDDGTGLMSFISLSGLTPGEILYVRVFEYGNNQFGTFDISVTTIAPVNDECADAIAINCGDIVSGTTLGAHIDDAVAPDCGASISSPGVWYTFTDESGFESEVTLSMCPDTGGSADFDTKLSVYTGNCSGFTCVTGNDDSCDLVSEVTFDSDGSSTYYVLVHAFGGQTGYFTLTANCTYEPIPSNDQCIDAMELDVQYNMDDFAATTPYAGTILGATDSGVSSASCGGGTTNDDVWFTFIPNINNVHITFDEAFDGVINLYSGSCGSLVEEGCHDLIGAGIEQIDATGLTVGEEYIVRIYNWYPNLPSTPTFDVSIWTESSGVGIADTIITGFSMYPNPVEDVLNLTAQNTIDAVSIYNLLGQEVVQATPSATETQIDMSNLPTGAYIVKVQAGTQVGSYNLIKE